MRLDHLLSRDNRLVRDIIPGRYRNLSHMLLPMAFHSSAVGACASELCSDTHVISLPAREQLNKDESSILLSEFKQELKQRIRPTRPRTSYTEYEVDALALKAEEGRGDRRNVQGELHTSDEP